MSGKKKTPVTKAAPVAETPTISLDSFTVPEGYALALRTCNADMTSHNGFVWPTSGHVASPDWKPTKECGHGLHGLLRGEGNGELLNWQTDAVWLAVLVELATVVDLNGKVKFAAAEVVLCGSRLEVTEFIKSQHPGSVVVGSTATAGYKGTATAGYKGTATAGNYGTATAGDYGTATAGNYGTATAGDYGTATAGNYGTATAGDYGTATAGYYGTATAGYKGTATAGYKGTVVIKWRDSERYRFTVGYVGENGVLPNVKYRCTKTGELVVAESAAS